MTTILTDNGFAHIGRRSELGPDDGMMFRRRLIRSNEAGLGSKPISQTLGVSSVRHHQRATGERSDRAVGDERLLAEIRRVHKANYACYRFAAGLQTAAARGEQDRSLHGPLLGLLSPAAK
jgi:hypothetical protein